MPRGGDPPRRVFEGPGNEVFGRRNYKREESSRRSSFDLENERAPEDWRNQAGQISLGAFKVTIANTEDDIETKREISAAAKKQESKKSRTIMPIKIPATHKLKALVHYRLYCIRI